MAIVVYKCDTCKREIEVPQNIHGIEIMSRCIITSGCKGKLSQTQVKSSHIRGKLPAPDPTGLKDWVPRQTYYKQEQPLLLRVWKIKHNLGTNPSIRVSVELDGGGSVETDEFVTNHVNLFETWITFSEPRKGNIQCFARTSITEETRELLRTPAPARQMIDLTANNILTLAVPSTFQDRITITFLSTTTNTLITLPPMVLPTTVLADSPWKTFTTINSDVFFMGTRMKIKTINIASHMTNAGISVPDGSVFYFNGYSTSEYPLQAKQVYALLSHHPHSKYDRNMSQLVDLSSITASAVVGTTKLLDNSLLIDPQLVQVTYPKIVVVS